MLHLQILSYYCSSYPKHRTIERGIPSDALASSPARGYAGPDALTYNAIDNEEINDR